MNTDEVTIKFALWYYKVGVLLKPQLGYTMEELLKYYKEKVL